MMSCLKISSLLILLFYLSACSSGEPVEIPEHLQGIENLTAYPPIDRENPERTIQLVPEMTFGETGDLFIQSIGQTAVDESGRVFMSSPQDFTLHVFTPTGDYLSSIGREGEGPWEYRRLTNMKIYSGLLYVHDSMNMKIDVYSTDSLERVHTIPINIENWSHVDELSNTWLIDFFVMEDATLLVKFSETPSLENADSKMIRYYMLNREGELLGSSPKIMEVDDVIHRLYETSRFTLFLTPPYDRKPLVAVRRDGHIFTAWTEDFLIKEHSPDGEYLQAFYHSFIQSELNEREYLDGMNSTLRDAELSFGLPATWPALESMMIDDENRFWVATITDDEDVYEWWVLSEEGERVGTFTHPRDQPIHAIKDGNLYSRKTDEETGLQEVVRYRIEISGT